MLDFEKYDVVIPVCNPDKRLYELLRRLLKQEEGPHKIRLYLTVTEKFSEPDLLKRLHSEELADKGIEVTAFPTSEFNHGGTRQRAAMETDSPYVLFMTQDAVPRNRYMTKKMLESFRDAKVAVCYARQLPYRNAVLKEKFARGFNYPDESVTKDRRMLDQGKIKAIFCSDVCAMYDTEVLKALGGFETKVDFNEDMLYAYKALSNGYRIRYASKALVYHSHNLSYIDQFKRNKALAISQKQHDEVFGKLSSEDEGIKYAKEGIKYMAKNGNVFDIVDFVADCGFRFMGFRAGKLVKNCKRSTQG